MLEEKIRQLANALLPDIVEFRRHLHAHPELSFAEHQTSKFLQHALQEANITFKSGWVKTGITGTIEGQKPGSRIIALRADMDALPIQETNDVPYKSLIDGVMHACGHDVHMASLYGALRILQQTREHWEGTVKFIFQPGEEKLPGGASLMINEGALKDPKPDSIFGQHVHPPLEAGKVGFRPGPYMASADEIYITVRGKGGHAAIPQENIDPIVMAAELIISLQQLVSRQANPTIPTVLSFGKIEGKGATNVIPDEVKLEGTFRTFDENWRKEAHQLIRQNAQKVCEAHGGSADVDIRVGYPFVNNEVTLTDRAVRLAREFLGSENVVELPQRMTGEDFSYYTHHMPGCFYRLGTGNKSRGITANIHTSTFNIDEEALRTGMSLMAWLAAKA